MYRNQLRLQITGRYSVFETRDERSGSCFKRTGAGLQEMDWKLRPNMKSEKLRRRPNMVDNVFAYPVST